jgi:peptidoglycan hydrolase-like protein with peptidoglycan-binding domain
MTLLFNLTRQGCVLCGRNVEDRPISESVSASKRSSAEDVKMVQQLLNAVPAPAGGPKQQLAVDGLCGAKTNAAIVAYQNKTFGWSDGRVDPDGPTIHKLIDFVLNSPTIPSGPLAGPSSTGSGSSAPAVDGALIVAVAKVNVRVLAPSINLLRWRLARADDHFLAFMDKHFSTGLDKATRSDISHLMRVLAGIDKYVARCNAFGLLPAENALLFDPESTPDFVARTVRGGDKMSTRQTQLYRNSKGVVYKAPGQSIWLSSLWADELTWEKHLTLLHEFAHFVGPRDGQPATIDDQPNAGRADLPRFMSQSRYSKLHNAESVALFILEFCIGTSAILTIPRLSGRVSHFSKFPKVEGHELVMH